MPGQDLYVTSNAIKNLRSRVENELQKAAFESARAIMATVVVDSPGFGHLGDLIIGGTFRSVCHDLDETIGEGETAARNMCTTLEVGRFNWQLAENRSVVKYVS